MQFWENWPDLSTNKNKKKKFEKGKKIEIEIKNRDLFNIYPQF